MKIFILEYWVLLQSSHIELKIHKFITYNLSLLTVHVFVLFIYKINFCGRKILHTGVVAGQNLQYALKPEVFQPLEVGVCDGMDLHTYKQMDMATLWVNWPSGPIQWGKKVDMRPMGEIKDVKKDFVINLSKTGLTSFESVLV